MAEPIICPTCEEAPRTLRGDLRVATLAIVIEDNNRLRAELTKAREMVKRYIVAQGPHLYESWREALMKDCGLVEDALGFVTVPPIGGGDHG